MPIRHLSISIVVLLFIATTVSLPQEPAFLNIDFFSGSKQAIRYEQATGVFHYVVPCNQPLEADRFSSEPAICWPVGAVRLRLIDGKMDAGRAVKGTLTVSATRIRFIPELRADMDFYWQAPVAGARFNVDPSKNTAILQSSETGYRIGFSISAFSATPKRRCRIVRRPRNWLRNSPMLRKASSTSTQYTQRSKKRRSTFASSSLPTINRRPPICTPPWFSTAPSIVA